MPITTRLRVRRRVLRRTPATLAGVAGRPTLAMTNELMETRPAPAARLPSERIKSLRFMFFSSCPVSLTAEELDLLCTGRWIKIKNLRIQLIGGAKFHQGGTARRATLPFHRH